MSSAISRRALLGGAGAAALTALSGATAFGSNGSAGRLRVYVIVVDGCRPDEVTGPLMPTVRTLAGRGTSFAAARAIPIAETIPNHVAMMSGVHPSRSGVPANSVYDAAEGVVRDLDRPADLRGGTLLDRLPAELGQVTGSVLSKDYLFGIFGERASHRWSPSPLLPITDHAPDLATMDAALRMIDEHDPALLFVNLGDVDRFGHADLTGTSLRLLRTIALIDTDAQLGRLVSMLHHTGRWDSSVLVLLSDHSMDWSQPLSLVSLTDRFAADPLLAGNVQLAQNGGAELCYWTGAEADRADAIVHMRRIALDTPGVLSIADPAELHLGQEAGDLVAFCRAGWRFTDPTVISNPIPGNHGHPATEQIPLLISGGHPAVRRGVTSSAPASTLDVAPTVAALFGLPAPPGGWDGNALKDAFGTFNVPKASFTDHPTRSALSGGP